MNNFVPKKMFLTKGVGVDINKLTSFEMALRKAQIANLNLVRVSSICPPHCKIITKEEGLKEVFTTVRWDSSDLIAFFKSIGFDKSKFINLKSE